MAHIGIDTTQFERTAPTGSKSPLPLGVYTLTIVRIQQKETNDKQGVYEEVEFDISVPAQFSNRKFWDRFNIINKSAKAQQIGREGIADLAKAAGIHGALNDDQELLGKTVQARLYVKPSDNPQYPDPKNECRKYYPVGIDADAEDAKKKGVTPVAQPSTATSPAKANWGSVGTTPAASAPSAAAPQPTAAPWGRK